MLLPVRSVGVMGDQRTYQEAVALRAVTTEDFMTADWARLPHDLLAQIANRIVNEVSGRQPGGLRYHQQTAGDDRVGVDSRQKRLKSLLQRSSFGPGWLLVWLGSILVQKRFHFERLPGDFVALEVFDLEQRRQTGVQLGQP